MENKFNIILLSIFLIIVILFGVVSFRFNQKNKLLNEEITTLNQSLKNVKETYSTKEEVPEIIFDKIESCIEIKVGDYNWNFDSDVVYAKNVCKAQGRSCFTATFYAMEAASKENPQIGDVVQNAFAKGNFGCNMPLSKSSLDNRIVTVYSIICC